MNKDDWFILEDTDNFQYVRIVLNEKKFTTHTKTDFTKYIAPARVFGLSYSDFLNIIPKIFKESVRLEKINNFPVVEWERNPPLYIFARLLNSQLNLIMEKGNYGKGFAFNYF